VVVTAYDRGFLRALRLLRRIGRVERTGYRNVIAVTVDDVDEFLDRLATLAEATPDVRTAVSRAMPCALTFDFRSHEEFEAKAREIALGWAPALAGKSFHVRMHRRGLKGRISSQDEERFLDRALLEALEASGTPGSITFENPDAIVDVETLGGRAGMSLWSREDLRRHPFLKID
jgi:tRNA(Ser,Leu) C12 N-acetylase TAN1